MASVLPYSSLPIDPTADELAGAIAPYDGLIAHPNTVVDAALLAAAENLKIIGRAGVTVDNIDIDAASERRCSARSGEQ